jgi:hypothetical protein
MIKIEMTDTYGGETNYSWVTRKSDSESKSLKQAITKFKKDQGIKCRHKVHTDTGDFRRVDLAGTCICIMAWEEY